MFDFIPVVNDRMVLALMKKAMDRGALDLYFRPFTIEVWIMICVTLGIIAIILISLSYFETIFIANDKVLKKATRIVLFFSWLCYLVIEIYFEGALTMFFTTKMGIPFDSIREVMRAYPDWRLLMRSGYEAYYTQYVESGDVDYIKFWDRVQKEPDENTFSSVAEAINKYDKEPVIIHDVEGAISTYEGDATEYLDVFEKGRTEWYGLIVTENSPLGPMLAHGAKKLNERGVFDYLKTRWLGRPDHCRPLLDVESSNMVLGLEHVSVVFVIFAGLLIISFMVFLAEVYKKNQKQVLITRRNFRNRKKEIQVSPPDEENELKVEKEDKVSAMGNIFNLIWNVQN